jgi:dTDP-4-dehydrorhamnose 3,5-epimerase-like enzyme
MARGASEHWCESAARDRPRHALLIPAGCGDEICALLEDDTYTLYMMGEFYAPGAQSGLRHDDPILGLSWPLRVEVISVKDRNWKLLEAAELEIRQRMSAPGVALSNVAGLGHCSGAEG